ncbi:MAG: hypothetical protein GQE15_15870 [Archangiaceae bacterium]|nr:hypothetical protein [Archangiaceae bacterium]
MQRLVVIAALGLSFSALAQVSIVNDIVVVQDPGGQINALVGFDNMSIFPSKQEQFCRAAFNAARAGGLADNFDGIFSFTAAETLTDLDNVWQGPPVRFTARNIGRDGPFLNTSTYTSQKLSQCVFMGTLGRTSSLFGGQGTEALPANPDSAWAPSLGIPIPGVTSLAGIEMLGHEYGHHWLNGIEFDQNDGRGRQHFIRGFGGANGESGEMGHPNQHYSHLADSRSVMYGECITDLGNGSFRFEGCDRKYSHIDQYLMGLRGSCEVSPMMVLEDPASPGQGVDSAAMGKTSSGMTKSGLTRHDITADEIIRAMGRRSPAYPHAPRCWRVAFVVVLAPGQTTVPPTMLAKVERYRQRWNQWFVNATDGRGEMRTNVIGPGCPVQLPIADPCDLDAGVRWPDGGVYVPDDAGVVEPDAGVEVDAGVIEVDAGVDAGVMEPVDAGPTPDRDGGVPECLTCETTKIRNGCGCGATDASTMVALLGLVSVLRRRSRSIGR